MWINYTDKEVETFHPLCEIILNKALVLLNLENNYMVEHHRMTGSLEMDFVVSNKTTGKILCVVEVKRTIEAVLSTRYQLQAMGYVQQLREQEKEKEYYILTNLEAIALFKYSKTRPKVIDQLLSPGIHTVKRFSEADREQFIDIQSHYFAEIIRRVKNDDSQYYTTFRNFVSELTEANDSIINDLHIWHSKFAALAYEYIRGVLDAFNRPELIDIRRLHFNIARICSEAMRVNFKSIYNLPSKEYSKLGTISSEVLRNLYDLGNEYKDADIISDILFNLIAAISPYPGAVPTDLDLAKALAVLASVYCPEIKECETIMDPAAGSGNLLSVVPAFYPSIKPCQLIANDINEYLQQVLSFRIGLKFPSQIQRNNSPMILNYNVCELPKKSFDKTRLIVLNPPYLSHTSDFSQNYKGAIISRIKEERGDVITNSSKSSLEAVFIELVASLAKNGTTICCIVPLSHLYGQGESSKLFRQMLLEQFGLQCIFRYPQSNVFKTVAQNTCILIGCVGKLPENIVYLSSNDTMDNIDYDALRNAAISPDFENQNGIEKSIFSRNSLKNSINEGWHILDSIAKNAMEFLKTTLSDGNRFTRLQECNWLRNNGRGQIGNKGANPLLFPAPGTDFYKTVEELAAPCLKLGIRTITNLDSPILSDCKTRFLDVSMLADDITDKIISNFQKHFKATAGKQAKKQKSIAEYKHILKSESRFKTPAGSVMLARDCRKKGKAFLITSEVFASTNVWIFNISDLRAGKLYHSWFCSVFYQLNCELVGKNHAGTRKLDKSEINYSFVPDFGLFTKEEIDSVCECGVNEFIELSEPKTRPCDIVWAKILAGEDWENVLNEAQRYLYILATDREA